MKRKKKKRKKKKHHRAPDVQDDLPRDPTTGLPLPMPPPPGHPAVAANMAHSMNEQVMAWQQNQERIVEEEISGHVSSDFIMADPRVGLAHAAPIAATPTGGINAEPATEGIEIGSVNGVPVIRGVRSGAEIDVGEQPPRPESGPGTAVASVVSVPPPEGESGPSSPVMVGIPEEPIRPAAVSARYTTVADLLHQAEQTED